MIRVAGAVAVGAIAGALCRAGVAAVVPKLGGIVVGTLAVNLVGSFVLGLLLGGTDPEQRELRAAVGTGFCGALTTMSTFAVETVDAPPATAALNVALHVGGSVGCAALGLFVARWLRAQ